MAIAFLLEFPGMTQQQYDSVTEKLQFGGKTAPGQLFHVAGPIEGGWRVIDVWESPEIFDKFLHERLAPLMREAGIAPPQAKTFPVHNMLTP